MLQAKQEGNLKYAHEGASSLEKFRVQCKKICSNSVAIQEKTHTHVVKCVYLSFIPESNFFLVWQIKPQLFYIAMYCCFLLCLVCAQGCERSLFLLFHMLILFWSYVGWMNTVVCSVYFLPSILPSFVDVWNAILYYATKILESTNILPADRK